MPRGQDGGVLAAGYGARGAQDLRGVVDELRKLSWKWWKCYPEMPDGSARAIHAAGRGAAVGFRVSDSLWQPTLPAVEHERGNFLLKPSTIYMVGMC